MSLFRHSFSRYFSREAGHVTQQNLLGRRFPEADSLRGLGVMLVMFGHVFGPPLFWATSLLDMFFFFSGLFITRILLEVGSSPRGYYAFYVRRALRIWPLYYSVIGVCLLANWIFLRSGWGPGFPVNTAALLQYLTFTQFTEFYVPYTVHYHQFLTHTWSLAVEEQFYLLWPLVGLLMARRMALALWLMGVLSVLSIGIRFTHLNDFLIVTRFDSLVSGALVTLLASDLPAAQALRARWHWPRLLAALLLLSGVGVAYYLWQGYADLAQGQVPLALGLQPWAVLVFKLFLSAAGAYVYLQSGAPELRALRWKPMMYLGRISYQIYMLHYPVLLYGENFLTREYAISRISAGLLMAAVTLGLSHLWYQWVDRPINRYKTRFPYSPVTRTAAATSAAPAERSN